MKLLDLVEGYDDPPEYLDPSRESFVDEDFNSVKLLFTYLGHDKTSGFFIVEHRETKEKYISHTDYIDSDMYVADVYQHYDRDEDGGYYYEEIDEDNAIMTSDSMSLYATIAFNEGFVGVDYDEWESGVSLIKLSNVFLRGLYLNDKKNYKELIRFIQEITLKQTGKK